MSIEPFKMAAALAAAAMAPVLFITHASAQQAGDDCDQPPPGGECVSGNQIPSFPDNNGGNPARPFPIGSGADECACGAYSYDLTSSYSATRDECKFFFVFTWEDCVQAKQDMCYKQRVATTYDRVDGAPDCCGPPTTYQHTTPGFDGFRDNTWYRLVTNDHSVSSRAKTVLKCASKKKWTVNLPCPAYQSGNANPTIATCEKETAWSGDVMTVQVSCCAADN